VVLGHREQPPLARHGLELVDAAVGELDPRADHEILDSSHGA
jgi:hypothetical protein